jgi:hypothetical protein
LRRTVSSGALRRKTSAGFASGQGFFVGITPAATGRMYGKLVVQVKVRHPFFKGIREDL